jgi:deoxyhypusine synthase
MASSTSGPSIPAGASAAVLKPSDPIPDDAISVEGPNFDLPLNLASLLESYKRIGFQANSLGKAIDIVNKMVRVSTMPFQC